MSDRVRMILSLVSMGCLVLGLNRPVFPAEERAGGPAELNLEVGSEPIQVSAQTLVWDHKGHRATFHQNVIARQKDLVIHCDDLIIYFNENDSDITRLVSKGSVKIVQMDRRASCDEAIYDRSENRIILEGNPVIRQGENEVRGQRIIFFLAENRSVVEGGEQGRVQVTLIPEKRDVSSPLP